MKRRLTRTRIAREPLALNLIGFILNVGINLATALISIYFKDLGYSGTDIGFFYMFFMIVYALSAMFVGRLSDVIGYCTPIVLSCISYICIGLMVYFLRSPLVVGSMYVLMGLALGLFTPAALASLSKPLSSGAMTTTFAFFYTSTLAGSIIGSYLCGLISMRYGFPILFLMLSGTAVSSLLLSLSFLRNKHMMASPRPRIVEVFSSLRSLSEFHELFRFLLIGLAFHAVGFSCISPYISLYGQFGLHLTKEQVGLLLSLLNFGSLATLLVWGRVADKVGARLILIFHLIFSAVSWLTYSYSPNLSATSLAILGWGIVASMDMPSRRMIITELSPSHLRATAMGLADFITNLFGSIGFVIGGLTWDYVGMHAPFLMAVLMSSFGIPFLFKLRIKKE